MPTVPLVLAGIGIVLTAVAAAGKVPLWAPVFILYVLALLQLLPR